MIIFISCLGRDRDFEFLPLHGVHNKWSVRSQNAASLDALQAVNTNAIASIFETHVYVCWMYMCIKFGEDRMKTALKRDIDLPLGKTVT